MALKENIKTLLKKGVRIPAPDTVYIEDDVEVENISGDEVTIYPGCRIYGKDTVLSPGVTLGYEGPVTIDNCKLGGHVELKEGFFQESLFLEKSNMGSGAHVRQCCILEEEANGAHCVGLKQTILLPFVTLGSLINLCDCLMAGGTSRKDHSEVGSSYIHFNFTPYGDKATPSLIGDVPRGVMLNQPRIFLGGQGGLVGPSRLGFGTVIAAGSIFRGDCLQDGMALSATNTDKSKPFEPYRRKDIQRIFTNNIHYISNLIALKQWYMHVRKQFFHHQIFGDKLCNGALKILDSAIKERVKRLSALVEEIQQGDSRKIVTQKNESLKSTDAMVDLLTHKDFDDDKKAAFRDEFLEGLNHTIVIHDYNYIETIQGLDSSTVSKGVNWLGGIVDKTVRDIFKMLPLLDL